MNVVFGFISRRALLQLMHQQHHTRIGLVKANAVLVFGLGIGLVGAVDVLNVLNGARHFGIFRLAGRLQVKAQAKFDAAFDFAKLVRPHHRSAATADVVQMKVAQVVA